MKVTSKGQVTIPEKLRIKYGIMPGSNVCMVGEAGRIYITREEGSGPGEDLVRKMTGKGNLKMTTDEIMALTRGDR